jgi:hypothetical protein
MTACGGCGWGLINLYLLLLILTPYPNI